MIKSLQNYGLTNSLQGNLELVLVICDGFIAYLRLCLKLSNGTDKNCKHGTKALTTTRCMLLRNFCRVDQSLPTLSVTNFD